MTGSTRSFNWGYPLGGFAGSRKATPWGLLGSPPGSRPLGMTNLPGRGAERARDNFHDRGRQGVPSPSLGVLVIAVCTESASLLRKG